MTRDEMDAAFKAEAAHLIAGMNERERAEYEELTTRPSARSQPVVMLGLARYVRGLSLSKLVEARTRPYLPKRPGVRTLRGERAP